MPRASWDFELGDLRGWTLTGTAFNNQPTLGDNTYARSNYGENLVTGFNAPTADWLRSPIITFHGDSGRHIGAQGVYWVGTYENRRTDGTAAGEVQGDAPVGTMTSPPFIIGGVTLDTATGERGDHATTANLQIGFLVGGGCRAKETYVELLVDGEDDPLSAMRTAAQSASGQGATSTASKAGVDAAGYTNGMSVLRATGRCEEAMRRVWWNVTSFSGRSARLRIVDSSKTHWGHINFDDVLFSWHGPGLAMQGGLGMSAGAGDLGTGQTGSAGAAYAFRRKSAGASEELCACTCTGTGCACDGAKWSCDWQEQSKLQASDKRSGDLFGFAVDVDDASGVVVIGAPGRSGTDQVRAPSLLLCSLRLRFHLHPFAAALQRTLTRPSFSFPSRRPPAPSSVQLQLGAQSPGPDVHRIWWRLRLYAHQRHARWPRRDTATATVEPRADRRGDESEPPSLPRADALAGQQRETEPATSRHRCFRSGVRPHYDRLSLHARCATLTSPASLLSSPAAPGTHSSAARRANRPSGCPTPAVLGSCRGWTAA